MEFSVRHLVKRNGIYYFRYRLPGKNLEIKVSLRTGDLKKAVAASKLASEKLRSLIDSGVARMIPLDEIRKRITVEIGVADISAPDYSYRNHVFHRTSVCIMNGRYI